MGGVSEFDVVYDTGSDWLVIEGEYCSNCTGDKYDPNDSEGNPRRLAFEKSDRSYGSAYLTGYEYLDKVCLTLDKCVESFQFFLIDSAQGISEPIDGIMGLAQGHPVLIAPDARGSGPLYVEALYNDGIISANKFSFYFESMGGTSWLDLGEPNLDNIKAGSSLVDTQLLYDFYWSFEGMGFAVGTVDNAYGFANEEPSEYGYPL